MTTKCCLRLRNLHQYDAELKKLGKYGIKQNKAIAVLYCMLALSNSRRRIPANNLDKDYMKWVEQEEVEKDAQDNGYDFGETYQTALAEMKQGYKVSHWIWYP